MKKKQPLYHTLLNLYAQLAILSNNLLTEGEYLKKLGKQEVHDGAGRLMEWRIDSGVTKQWFVKK